MNKRQRKKATTKAIKRFKYLGGNAMLIVGRSNGKTNMYYLLLKVCTEKSYKRFKIIKKITGGKRFELQHLQAYQSYGKGAKRNI